VLGYSLKSDSKAADEWTATNGGVFFCAGVGGRIAGRRADLGLIDDPVGSKEDAYSKLIRDKTWDWYKFDFTTRLKPGAAVVIIQTRWHEEDLSGKLLAEEPDDWEVINLPMLAKQDDALGRAPGELLWTEWFGKDEKLLRDAQADKSKWSALYQQDPTPEDGDYFRREWIEGNAYDRGELPPLQDLVTYCSSDHAVSLREEGDSTCMVSVGVDERGTIWVLPDIYWDKCDTLEAVRQMLGMMRRVNPMTWWAEADKIAKSIGPFLKKQMREEMVFCYIDEIHPTKDKSSRAQSIRGRMQAGAVRFPRFATWYGDALLQMLKFPAGAHDDFIDPLAYIGLGLDKMTHGSRPPSPVDETQHLEHRPITLRWIRASHKRKERSIIAKLQDS
jgi:predicted phage terminase large subunit-like protein